MRLLRATVMGTASDDSDDYDELGRRRRRRRRKGKGKGRRGQRRQPRKKGKGGGDSAEDFQELPTVVDDLVDTAQYEEEDAPADDEDAEDDGFGAFSGWGPMAFVSRTLRVQARVGVRAATLQLRPGLYLVAELEDRQVNAIGGPVKLATKIIDAAIDAIKNKDAAKQAEAKKEVELGWERRRSPCNCGRCRS